jgi:hypothetical protein
VLHKFSPNIYDSRVKNKHTETFLYKEKVEEEENDAEVVTTKRLRLHTGRSYPGHP